MKLEYVEVLMKNPFEGSEILAHFATGFGQDKIPVHLFYLVLPLVLYKPSRVVFANISQNNNIALLLRDNREIAANLQKRISALKRLTNLSMIVASNRNYIDVNIDITLKQPLDYRKSNENQKEMHRAAYYLGLIASKEKSHIHVFKHFKVIPQ